MSGFDDIQNIAKQQQGFVATYQLPTVSAQLFAHHEKSGNLERVHRGIYRLEVFPDDENEQFIIAYLWSHQRGTISHESALNIHEISDALPSKVHICLPEKEKPVRRQTPPWLRVHFADIENKGRQWFGPVRVTTPARTLFDIATNATDVVLFEQALDQAKDRGLVPQDFERRLILELVAKQH